jgi:hypothetical protein
MLIGLIEENFGALCRFRGFFYFTGRSPGCSGLADNFSLVFSTNGSDNSLDAFALIPDDVKEDCKTDES